MDRQKIYNNIGILLVIGIIGGTGLLLIKYSDDLQEPIKIINPRQAGQAETSTTKAEQTASKININTATASELDSLSGIGPAIAQKIIDYRTQNGLFTAIEDLKKVPGIGDSKFEAIKNEVSL